MRIGARQRLGPALDEEIGRWVRAERTLARLRQVGLAARAGMTEAALSAIARGERRLGFAEACALADALELGVEAFRPPR